MADIKYLVGTDGDDNLGGGPGLNDYMGGPGNDSIDGTDGVNTIHFNLGDGVDTVLFAPPRTYQYADFLHAATQGLAQLESFSGSQYTNDYFATADQSLYAALPSGISSVLADLHQHHGVVGSVDPAVAKAAFTALNDWINTPISNLIQFGAGITLADLTVQTGATAAFGTPAEFSVAVKGQEGVSFQLGVTDNVAGSTDTPPALDIQFRLADGTSFTLDQLLVSSTAGAMGTQFGSDMDDSLRGSLSGDSIYGLDGNDKIDGSAGFDTLDGGAGDDVIAGGSGGDYLFGGDGNDVLAVGRDGGVASGGAGDDVYAFNRGDGGLSIDNMGANAPGEVDTISFGKDVDPALVAASVDPSSGNLTLSIPGTGDMITIPWFDSNNGMAERADQVIDRVQFFDATGTAHVYDLVSLVHTAFPDPSAADPTASVGLVGSATELSVEAAGGDSARSYALSGNLFPGPNQAPTAIPVIDPTATQDAAFSYVVPAATFVDPEGAILTLTATTADDHALPAWLQFDAATGTFTGTPTNSDVGSLALKVTATDPGGLSASETFNLQVHNVNDAPAVAHAIAEQSATQDADFSYMVPGDTFADIDVGDQVTYAATLADGSALPSWLTFAPATGKKLNSAPGTLSGTPTNADVGALSIMITATDMSGATASSVFALTVDNVNDAPTATDGIAVASATEDAVFTYTLPDGTFSDVDAGDSLTYRATLADGSALPGWLQVDPATGTLSGTPVNDDVGNLSVIMTATDSGKASVSKSISIGVVNTNDAPTVANAIADQTATQNAAFSYVVPTSTFADVDVGDKLTYSAKLADGSALPSWLNFNAATRTLSGTAGAAGQWDVQLMATDLSGASVSDVFSLTVNPVQTGGMTINGVKGDDKLYGGSGDDKINGGKGKDLLVGGAGNDTLYFSEDGKWGSGTTRTDASTGEKVSIKGMRRSYDVVDGGTGSDTLMGTSGSDAILLDDKKSPAWQSGARIVGVEKIDAGAGNDVVDLTSKRYTYGDVEIDGGSGNDVLWSSSGNDVLRGGSGNDSMDGGAGNDYLEGGSGNDKLDGGKGVDLLQGGSGNDTLKDTSGNGLLDGGSGNDTLTEGSGNSMLVGGKGNDHLHLGGGYDIVAFNRGDGRDVVSSGKDRKATLSLGGGISYTDLTLSRSGNDLILDTGKNDRITFEKWYEGKKYQAVSKLQVVADAMPGFDETGSDTSRDDRIETFDFQGLVKAFDTARSHNPGLSKWTLTNALAQFHLGGSDTEALGGDLAYQYGLNGTLAGIAVNAAQDTAGSGQFGKQAQSLHSQAEVKSGLVKLS